MPTNMKKYLITIIMPDGSRGTARGLYPSDWAAISSTLDNFPDALNIAVRRLK